MKEANVKDVAEAIRQKFTGVTIPGQDCKKVVFGNLQAFVSYEEKYMTVEVCSVDSGSLDFNRVAELCRFLAFMKFQVENFDLILTNSGNEN